MSATLVSLLQSDVVPAETLRQRYGSSSANRGLRRQFR
jgi:hypothetical protein